MASIFRKTVRKPVPLDAIRSVDRQGRTVAKYEVGPKNKCRKKTSVVQIDPATGAEYLSIQVGSYIAKFRDYRGQVRTVVTGCVDEIAAQQKLNELLERDVQVRRKLITPSELAISDQQDSLTTEHLERYLDSMRSAGNTVSHVDDCKQKITRLVAECGFKRLGDISRDSMEAWLVSAKAMTGKQDSKEPKRKLSNRSKNSYLQAIGGFLNWCIDTNRMNSNPLLKVQRSDERVDRRKQRRAMTETELSRLLRVAMFRPLAEYGRQTVSIDASCGKRSNWTYVPLVFDSLESCCEEARKRLGSNPAFVSELEQRGLERMLTYKALVLTGLRCNELRSITVGQVDTKSERPCIELLAKDEKNRHGSTIPIPREFANELEDWISQKPKQVRNGCFKLSDLHSMPLFNVPKALVKIMDRDLATAGIVKRDERGRTLDVHALRTTFGTMLSKAGVSPRTAQAAMRHSRIDLTMNVYTDPTLLDVAGAVESLPNIMPMVPIATYLQATGTHDPFSSELPPELPPTFDSEGRNRRFVSQNGKMGKNCGGALEVPIVGENHEKTLGIIEKPRVFEGVTNGTRTRDLRSHNPNPSPVLCNENTSRNSKLPPELPPAKNNQYLETCKSIEHSRLELKRLIEQTDIDDRYTLARLVPILSELRAAQSTLEQLSHEHTA